MSRRKAFTLVELLTVIAVISILIALLLPALKAVKRQAEKVVCVSNLRQIGTALLMYAHDYKGWFPLSARDDGRAWDSRWPDRQPEDWVRWQPGRDLNKSVIRPYLSSFKVLVCPAGIPDRDPRLLYPFSYSLNHLITSTARSKGPWELGMNVNLKDIIHPWHKLLAVEEDSLTINDGSWAGGFPDHTGAIWDTGQLSARHDLKSEYGDKSPGSAFLIGSGHGISADGSYLWVQRRHTRLSLYYTLPRFRGAIDPPPGQGGWSNQDYEW